MTPQQIFDRAFRIAANLPNSPVIDSEYLTEDKFKTALRSACVLESYKRDFALTLTDGEVLLPSGVILDQLNTATVYQDAGELSSYEKNYFDFLNPLYDQISYFTANNNKFCYREAGEDAKTFDGGVTLNCVALPDYANLTSDLNIPETLAQRCAEILAQMMVNAD